MSTAVCASEALEKSLGGGVQLFRAQVQTESEPDGHDMLYKHQLINTWLQMSLARQTHDLLTSMVRALPPIGTKTIEMGTKTRAFTGQSWEGTLGHAGHCAFLGDI